MCALEICSSANHKASPETDEAFFFWWLLRLTAQSTEMTMHDASPQSSCSFLPHDQSAGEKQSPRLVIHLSLVSRQTVSWRVIADCEIRAQGERVWLTRVFSPYDYWLQAGDAIRVARGERIWLSADGECPAEVTLTSEYVDRRRMFDRWPLRWLGHAFDILSPVAR